MHGHAAQPSPRPLPPCCVKLHRTCGFEILVDIEIVVPAIGAGNMRHDIAKLQDEIALVL